MGTGDAGEEIDVSENKIGCARPTGVALNQEAHETSVLDKDHEGGSNKMVTARVGSKAPDFEAPAYKNGQFITVKLSDYLGKWVLICFYPGDFTFV